MKDYHRNRLYHKRRRRRLFDATVLTVLSSIATQAFHISTPPLFHATRLHQPLYSSSSIKESPSVPEILQNASSLSSSLPNGATTPFVEDEDDHPRPTENGGFSHTKASKAKISAANAGKVPWNKGKQRSEETRRKIAEGVQRRNRERFLQKLKDMGTTEEEYNAKLEQAEREKQARRTAKGGFRPTEETKKKISKVLQQKYRENGIKRAPRNPDTVRRGFTHSEETRRKISESLKKKWATDEDYRARMKTASATTAEINARISATLKARWKDPVFREKMLVRMNGGSHAMTPERRKKISDSIKAKWQDLEYRLKITNTTSTLAERQAERRMRKKAKKAAKAKSKAPKITAVAPLSPKKDATSTPQLRPLQPISAATASVSSRVSPPSVPKKAAAKKPATDGEVKPKPKPRKKKSKQKDPTEEVRSDLYDLLFDDDDSLDEFDPYGLDDN